MQDGGRRADARGEPVQLGGAAGPGGVGAARRFEEPRGGGFLRGSGQAEPGTNPGVLVRHDTASAVRLLNRLGPDASGAVDWEELTMVEGRLDDGQQIRALNELYLGHPSHQSARYLLTAEGHTERQASSGLLVGTGTGATGWCASIAHDRGGRTLPAATDPALAWFVREAWPSPVTGTSLTEGRIASGERLTVAVRSDRLVVFGDGIESDRLDMMWGQDLTVGVADQRLRLAV